MEYQEFVTQFRERAAIRMAEFEKALAQAQAEADKAEKTVEEKKNAQVTQPPKKQLQPARGGARGRGPVQSILRKA